MISATELLTHLSAFALPRRRSLCYHSFMEAPNAPNETESHPQTAPRIRSSGDLEVSKYLEIAQGADRPQEPEAAARVQPESIVIIDFGSQYSMLIARRIRECNVYCELVPHDAPWEQVQRLNPRGIILSGGPASVYDEGAPMAPPYVFESGLPVLGICYGMNLLALQLGGKVAAAETREYGHAVI